MIFLGGGGSETDEANLWDEVFVEGRRLTLWPYAMPPDRRPQVERWFREALAPRGQFVFDRALDQADILAIPGGNTYDLLAAVRDMLPALRPFLERGGHIYGGSAGAILLGADIDIAGILDPNDIGLTDTAGADLLAGHVVYPHFTADQESTAARWAADHDVAVLAIPETAGVIVDGETARNAGPSPVQVLTPGAKVTYAASDVWSLNSAGS
ncbi:Type 1 glutamine amidotransferase-like domain-containing protein [Paractinoplanes lichenicola]|uniref:Type 1 glutamine amidotransferase-like domain-containing protein n=1 Tax=Paractinoplanes lichenicola TaxID=2802976 RepID=A0ABS1W2I8_9ACTN|nr:Type 1 glutamine amidotransferase-like domain-containing protein [Actinoplanes lichenicola]MBL7260923.1 Type 1 glutamine amidotransferase-like domain-containing protein [Actinoplanes lichenicola]